VCLYSASYFLCCFFSWYRFSKHNAFVSLTKHGPSMDIYLGVARPIGGRAPPTRTIVEADMKEEMVDVEKSLLSTPGELRIARALQIEDQLKRIN